MILFGFVSFLVVVVVAIVPILSSEFDFFVVFVIIGGVFVVTGYRIRVIFFSDGCYIGSFAFGEFSTLFSLYFVVSAVIVVVF